MVKEYFDNPLGTMEISTVQAGREESGKRRHELPYAAGPFIGKLGHFQTK